MDDVIKLPESCTLPDGYSWGAHIDGSRWWVVRDEDGAGVAAERRPDLVEVDDDEDVDDWGASKMTAGEVGQRIAHAFRGVDLDEKAGQRYGERG